MSASSKPGLAGCSCESLEDTLRHALPSRSTFNLQGPLEPVKAHMKGDKRGIGADKQAKLVPGTSSAKKRKVSQTSGRQLHIPFATLLQN